MNEMKIARRLAFTLCTALALVSVSVSVIAADKPDVVITLADNMGYGDLGCYGPGGELCGMPTFNIKALKK